MRLKLVSKKICKSQNPKSQSESSQDWAPELLHSDQFIMKLELSHQRFIEIVSRKIQESMKPNSEDQFFQDPTHGSLGPIDTRVADTMKERLPQECGEKDSEFTPEEKTFEEQKSNLFVSNKRREEEESTIDTTAEEVKEMMNENLKNSISAGKLVLPRNQLELDSLHKSLKVWQDTSNLIEELIQEISIFQKDGAQSVFNSVFQTDFEMSLTSKLSEVKEKLMQLEIETHRFSDYYRCFPFENGDCLLLIFKDVPLVARNAFLTVGGIYCHATKTYILDPNHFPQELALISTPKQFLALLKNAHIVMKNDPKNPSKSTFSIIQGCLGGVYHSEDIVRLIQDIKALINPLNHFFSCVVSILQIIGLRIEVPDEKRENFANTLFGRILVGIGSFALSAGFPVTWPLVSIGAGIGFAMKEGTTIILINRMADICELIITIHATVRSALDLVLIMQQLIASN